MTGSAQPVHQARQRTDAGGERSEGKSLPQLTVDFGGCRRFYISQCRSHCSRHFSFRPSAERRWHDRHITEWNWGLHAEGDTTAHFDQLQ
jgi:hypothetical protein